MSGILNNPMAFSAALYEIMCHINPGIGEMELYEFRYCLENFLPKEGWTSILVETQTEIEQRVNNRAFYDGIQIKPFIENRIILDDHIAQLSRMLFIGLVTGDFSEAWVKKNFYFDIRGFYFLHRTLYFTEKIKARLGGKPYRQFDKKQDEFVRCQDIGYKAFARSNSEIDTAFLNVVGKVISVCRTPTILAVAGPTAAGKTEIVERLRTQFEQEGRKTTSIEMDNFLTDRDQREARGIFTQSKKAFHLDLIEESLEDIKQGKKIHIPRYDFVFATSSHDLNGNLKPGGMPIEIEPADIIFIEGNFPFLLEEIAALIDHKVVYLTDDPIRLKRKWKRDIDYRKKYEPNYFRNRFFKDQFIMAEIAYRPQMEVCDMIVDTTGAALWVVPEIIKAMKS
jgi:uridine kinase